jgi:hypothetical protein
MIGKEKNQNFSHIRNDTQTFTFTGELVTLHYVAHLVDNPPYHDLSSFV